MKTVFVPDECLVREWTEKAPIQIEAPSIFKLYQLGEHCTKWWDMGSGGPEFFCQSVIVDSAEERCLHICLDQI